MEDKTRVVILAICYTLMLIVGAGLLVAVRIDIGKDAFYTALLILITILVVFAIQGVSLFGGRVAQRSDNTEQQTIGLLKAITQYATSQNNAQVQQLRVVRDALPASSPFPALTFNDDEDDEPVFDAVETDNDIWVGGNVPR